MDERTKTKKSDCLSAHELLYSYFKWAFIMKVTLEAYDGRKLNGFVYVSKSPPTGEKDPSARYLGVLVKGKGSFRPA